jgi:hypothetical protein
MPSPPSLPAFGWNGRIECFDVARRPAISAGAVIAEAGVIDLAALPQPSGRSNA